MRWLSRLLSRPPKDRAKLGRWGEKRTELYLRRRGYRLIARRFACPSGEIDIIMQSPKGCITFVEVKTRTTEDFAAAQEAVTYKKRVRMAKTAKFFVKKYKLNDKPLRFDVAAVVLRGKSDYDIRYYKNAFVPG